MYILPFHIAYINPRPSNNCEVKMEKMTFGQINTLLLLFLKRF
jgi:hypothetical protein